MRCIKCGAQLTAEDRFCPECGAKVNVNTAEQWFDEDSWGFPGQRYTGPTQGGYTGPIQGGYTGQGYTGNTGPSYHPEEPKRGAGLKIALAIAILAIVVAAGSLTFFMLKKGDDKKTASEKTTQVEEVAVATTAATTQAAEPETQETVPATQAPAATTQAPAPTTQETTEKKQETQSSNSDDFILPDSSSRYLKSSEVSGLSKYELRIARNEIYARHGRKFNDQELQKYFNGKSWYKGTIAPDDFVDEKILSQLERDNIKLIMSFEDQK